jgi:hypothetical protein
LVGGNVAKPLDVVGRLEAQAQDRAIARGERGQGRRSDRLRAARSGPDADDDVRAGGNRATWELNMSSPSNRPSDLVSASRFWQHFATHHWEQKELVTDHPALAAPMSEAQLFDLVSRLPESPARGSLGGRRSLVAQFIRRSIEDLAVRLSTRFLAPPQPKAPRLLLRFTIESPSRFINGIRVRYATLGRRGRLPRPDDHSFEGYHRRITSELNPRWRRLLGLRRRRYSLIINYPEMASFDLWETTSKQIAAPLYRNAGMNNGGYYYNIFMGDYSRTPFGVHVDDESLFHFPIVGTKALRLWPPEFVRQHPAIKGCMDYGSYVDGSVLVKASPGETIYWPSKYWHIGEGEGQFSVSLALGMIVRTEPYVMRLIRHQAPATLERFDSKTVPFDPDDPQASLRSVPLGVLRLPHRRKGAADTPAAAWLRAVSALGALCPPVPDTARAISDEEIVRGRPGCPVLTVPSTDHHLLIGAAGHVFAAPDTADVRGLIAFANSGSCERFGSLVERVNSETRQDEMRRLLGELIRCRALVRDVDVSVSRAVRRAGQAVQSLG